MTTAGSVDPENPDQAASKRPADPQFSPQLDARWALRLPDLLMVAGAAALYLLVSYLPLTDPGLWNAINYGDWIIEHRELPTSDWIMPYSEGQRVVETQWATDVLLARTSSLGDHWLTTLAAIVVAATFIGFGRAYWLLSRCNVVTLVVTTAVLVMAWTRYATFRPEHFGALCLAGLLWWAASIRKHNHLTTCDASTPDDNPSWSVVRWLSLGVLFCAWANLHASVVWGLVIVACWLIGTAIDTWRHEHSLTAVLANRNVQRWTFALELATIASCLNPHGVDLLLEIVWYAPQANLLDLPGWQPLVLLRSAGPGFAISIVALIAILRTSRGTLHSADTLAIGAIAIATILHQRYIAFMLLCLDFW